jgi:lysophospholipase L1-like esterase
LGLLALGLIVAEGSLWLLCALVPEAAARLSGFKPRYVADSAIGVRGDPQLPEYDEAGFRNAVRPRRATIVAIGDSQTEGNGVAREHAWPQRLAQILNVDIYQLAFGGYGPGEYRVLLDDALSLDPELILVGIYAGNDFADAYNWVYVDGRDPDLVATDAAIHRGITHAEEERGPLAHWSEETRYAKKSLAGSRMRRWLHVYLQERSKLVSLWQQLTWNLEHGGTWREGDREPDSWSEVRAIASRSDPSLLLPFESKGVKTVFTPRARRSVVDTGDPRIAEGLRLSVDLLRDMAHRVDGRARMAVVSIPTKELAFSARVARVGEPAPVALTELVAAERSARQQLAAALDASGIHVIDALATLKTTVADGRNPYPADWDGHPNAVGHDAIARAVAAAVATEHASIASVLAR